ncbi:glycosyltransferase family 2 protein [Weissella confusa]|uniref:glycosyltransferase family 2 protein n=1 Tax=Weissella confusa TaxID=1583 RepID=UPI0022DFC5D1|nr:glycosyltransferase family A protein [Weissella confusa]
MKKITIIIPAKNVSNYVNKAIESIERASTPSVLYEVIIVDDHSSEEEFRKLQDISSASRYIHLVRLQQNDPSGAGHARNVGLSKATGDYIYFMDADDEVLPTFFEVLNNVLNKVNVDMVFFGFSEYDMTFSKFSNSRFNSDEGEVVLENDARVTWFEKWFLENNVFSVWTKVYNKKFLVENNLLFPNTRTAQDAIFNVDVFAKANKIYSVPESLYKYNANRPGSNQTVLKSKFDDEKAMLDHLAHSLYSGDKTTPILQYLSVQTLVRELKYFKHSQNHSNAAKESVKSFAKTISPFMMKNAFVTTTMDKVKMTLIVIVIRLGLPGERLVS